MNESYTCIIVDDEPLAVESLTDQLTYLFKDIEILASCSNWKTALAILRTQPADLLFMDISLPEKNGIDILKLLPSIESEIIFITAHDEYALEAFNFNTSGYLLKPTSDAELALAVNKALSRARNKKGSEQKESAPALKDEKIRISDKNGINYVNIRDIVYLESANKCTKIVTASRSYISATPLIKFKMLVDDFFFLQVHRAYIINLNCILRYESSGLITMVNKDEVPIARGFRNDFLKHFNNNF